MGIPDLFAEKMMEAKRKSEGRGITDAEVLPHAYSLAWKLIFSKIRGLQPSRRRTVEVLTVESGEIIAR